MIQSAEFLQNVYHYHTEDSWTRRVLLIAVVESSDNKNMIGLSMLQHILITNRVVTTPMEFASASFIFLFGWIKY